MKRFVNLACGAVYINEPDWINLDYVPAGAGVRKANLLAKLPIPDETIDAIYCSHFFEHIPLGKIQSFLLECLRILKSGGTIRLVLPDLEEISREYLVQRERGDDQKANFVVAEMIDQCVRQAPGGELGRYYRRLSRDSNQEMAAYVRLRNGEMLGETNHVETHQSRRDTRRIFSGAAAKGLRLASRVVSRLERLYIRTVVSFLPRVFRESNVSMAAIGERHTWLWDYPQMTRELSAAGFVNIVRRSFDSTGIPCFPIDVLDAQESKPRKGAESMFVEATKPFASSGNACVRSQYH